ncbi:hypothetical protein AB0K74_36365 [Streptomyces sp. NPDC056159]|uniref:hypothetical protein n=1 Tax=Streptomyces sp. NPDC056159 TaxID=3155537 RepID=UPI003426940B
MSWDSAFSGRGDDVERGLDAKPGASAAVRPDAAGPDRCARRAGRGRRRRRCAATADFQDFADVVEVETEGARRMKVSSSTSAGLHAP